MQLGEKLWASYFQGVVTRTAGFNTIDIGAMNLSSLVFMMALMFIGASSGSWQSFDYYYDVYWKAWTFNNGFNTRKEAKVRYAEERILIG
jgi:hypothetical protein